MEFLAGLAIGSVWLWLGFVFTFALLVFAVESESLAIGFIVSFLLFAGLAFTGTFNIIQWVIANPVMFIVAVLAYVAAGALWSVLKWGLYVSDSTEQITDSFESFKNSSNLNRTIEDFEKSNYNFLKPSKNKRRITLWMIWWIPSIFWTVAHDLFKKIWNTLYDLLSSVYERISANKIRKVLK